MGVFNAQYWQFFLLPTIITVQRSHSIYVYDGYYLFSQVILLFSTIFKEVAGNLVNGEWLFIFISTFFIQN